MSDKALSAELTIVNSLGLHTRAATILVKLAQGFRSAIRLTHDGIEADAKSIMEILSLGAGEGKKVSLCVEGQDQDEAFEAIRNVIENGFHEGDEV